MNVVSPKTKLTNARCRAMMTDPWYGVIATRMIWVPQENVGTMGVRILRLGKVECVYSPSFVEEMETEQLIAVIKHEIEHIIRMHIPRSKQLKNNRHAHESWNIAADWVINGESDDPRIADLPPNGCYIPSKQNPGIWSKTKIKDLRVSMTTEEFFKWLHDNTERKNFSFDGDSSGNCSGVGGGNCSGVGSVLTPKGSDYPLSVDAFDNHDTWADSEASPEEMRNTAKSLARAATRACGNAPGHLTEAIKQLEKAEINWTYLLRSAVGRAAGGKRWTFAKRHRKRDQFGIKGYSKRNRVPLTIYVDTSGSVSDKMLQKFFGEIESASQYFKIRLVEFDHQVQQAKDYHKGDWKSIEVKGRGGTSFTNCLEFAEENGLIGKMNIMLTDGHAPIPEPRPYPFLWVLIDSIWKGQTSRFWGEVIFIGKDYVDDDY